MESYKRVTLSLILLLSIPLATFGMQLPDTPDSDGPPNTPVVAAEDLSALDEGDEKFYTPRASIKYTGFEDFDKRSVDDLTTDQAYQALLTQLQLASVATNTPPASPRITTPQMVMGAGAVGVLANALTTAAPTIRGIRINESRNLAVAATEGLFTLLDKFGYQMGFAVALAVLIAETRKTVHVEEENKKMVRQLKALQVAVKQLTNVNQKHELIEHGMVVTEQKLLKSVHDHLCHDAQLIAAGSEATQAVATLKALLKTNQKITKKVVLAMADLEKIHTDTATLLKGPQYSMLNPLGWFEALKNMCHKHSNADAAADTK
jgi:hypothetical protein